ncbi:PREDICTED: leucine-rich repeat-containing protein 58-like isoform X2 [Priapulus caudatus]|uniref:Leucine-rich repeat-containing protein 58-like isoform X1 n=1 Tax=Priapulus caudatus TaxID=37621 RepID=A0ABM1DYB7_PRICU|nr:PREDICTED: leucine-rich repeat-containing protein 58-like isoform X1 [Priapulus caudatus]XP_014664938.1 PREDICTED: leucine-rich repeat-containing protein 58-like isoform X2 [Priapulus caudatus]
MASPELATASAIAAMVAAAEEAETTETHTDELTVLMSHIGLETFPDDCAAIAHYASLSDVVIFVEEVCRLQVDHNAIMSLGRNVSFFTNLTFLDISNNRLTHISSTVLQLRRLKTLVAKNNLLEVYSLPKEFGSLTSLETLHFGGNSFDEFPMQLIEMEGLKKLFLGANQITHVPVQIGQMTSLEVLYLGGNRLKEVPATVGYLQKLTALILCNNQLRSLPSTVCQLKCLQTLSLHENRLTTLPPELTKLNLLDLSLRGNPLVVRFVQELAFHPPTLLELAARRIKIKNIPYSEVDLPRSLVSYLSTGKQCVNPNCKGVYFDSHVEKVNFVDFCGKYRLPLMQYLCLPNCTAHPVQNSDDDSDCDGDESAVASAERIKKVLLTQ